MISQLVQKIQKTKAPICVGLDPMLSYIPSHIVQNAFKEFGETLEGAAEAVWQFNKEIVDSTYDQFLGRCRRHYRNRRRRFYGPGVPAASVCRLPEDHPEEGTQGPVRLPGELWDHY